MKKEFKIGCRVQIIKFDEYSELVGENGVIVCIDNNDDLLLKMDNDVNTYNYCKFNDYKSERNDLVNVECYLNQKIKHI